MIALAYVPIEAIRYRAGFNVREDVGEGDGSFESLVASVRERGILQPVLLRPEGGLYVIVAGHRRVKAARCAGLSEVPANLDTSADTALIDMAAENCQRKDLNPVERAELYERLRDAGMTNRRIADICSTQPTEIPRYLSYLNLPNEVLDMARRGKIGRVHMDELAPLYRSGHTATEIILIARTAMERRQTAAELRRAVNERQEVVKAHGAPAAPAYDPRFVPKPTNLPKGAPRGIRLREGDARRAYLALRSAMERIAEGAPDPQSIARESLASLPQEAAP